MRCPDCNKFVGMENGDLEVDSLGVDVDGTVTVEASLPRNRRMIHQGWVSFERLVLPRDASTVQRRDMRRAFFCGASLLFYGVMLQASGGPADVVTDGDLEMMDGVQQEIDEFGEELDAAVLGAMKKGGRSH